MDFGSILYEAQKNDKNSSEQKWYRTSYSPPKKVKKDAQLSQSIQKFLAKKDEEEKQKKYEADVKKQNLLALRSQDKKSFKRVQSMLKSTKSANKSVLEDTGDTVGPAVPGYSQPDEDDYGYVSNKAAALYDKLVDKYSKIPDEPKFPSSLTKSTIDLTSTKDRVRAALQRSEEEKLLPRKRKRKSDKQDAADSGNEELEEDDPDDRARESAPPESVKADSNKSKEEKKRRQQIPRPPAMDFSTLLKIAEQKQYEPVRVNSKDEIKERPMTEMEKIEKFQVKEREARRLAGRNGQRSTPVAGEMKKSASSASSASKIDNAGKKPTSKSNSDGNKTGSGSEKPRASNKKPFTDVQYRNNEKGGTNENDSEVSYYSDKDNKLSKLQIGNKNSARTTTTTTTSAISSSSSSGSSNSVSGGGKSNNDRRGNLTNSQFSDNLKSKSASFAENNLRIPKSSPADVKGKINYGHSVNRTSNSNCNSSVQSSASLKNSLHERDSINRQKTDKLSMTSRQTQPSLEADKRVLHKKSENINPDTSSSKLLSARNDIRKPLPNKTAVPASRSDASKNRFKHNDVPDRFRSSFQSSSQYSKPPKPVRRHVIESDDEEDYDSEMDDFIDDSEDHNDYSRQISEIFGYDRSKYANVDEDDEDECMESNFSQLQKEEFISTKYGILEDLADIRQKKKEKERLKKSKR